MSRAFHTTCYLLVLITALLPACTVFRPRPPSGRLSRTDRALVKGFIQNVVKREAGVRRLQARTKFTLDSPDLDRRVSMRGFVAFAAPDKLRVQGHGALGTDAFDLISVGRSFVLHIPSENKTFFECEGVAVDSVPFTVSPADIAMELFRPIDWGAIDDYKIRVVRKDARSAVFEFGGDDVTRIITIDARWHVTRRERYDAGRLTCTTTLSDHTDIAGIPFPGRIEVLYPAERTYLDMRLSGVRLNGELNPELFQLPAYIRTSGVESSP